MQYECICCHQNVHQQSVFYTCRYIYAAVEKIAHLPGSKSERALTLYASNKGNYVKACLIYEFKIYPSFLKQRISYCYKHKNKDTICCCTVCTFCFHVCIVCMFAYQMYSLPYPPHNIITHLTVFCLIQATLNSLHFTTKYIRSRVLACPFAYAFILCSRPLYSAIYVCCRV